MIIREISAFVKWKEKNEKMLKMLKKTLDKYDFECYNNMPHKNGSFKCA